MISEADISVPASLVADPTRAAFLAALSESDASCRAKMIELGVPQSQETGGAAAAKDLWTADVTLAYTSYVR